MRDVLRLGRLAMNPGAWAIYGLIGSTQPRPHSSPPDVARLKRALH